MIDLLIEASTKPELTERVKGAADDDGMEVPFCQPETHKKGKHSFLCMSGVLGYRQADDGLWDRIPPDPLSLAGAQWSYTGHAYVRPVGRGVHLDDGARYVYLEDLPEGDYDVELTFTRRSEPSSEAADQ